MDVIEVGRRTGRTQRMLEAAVKAAEQGDCVLVVGANLVHAEQLRRRVEDMMGQRHLPRIGERRIAVGRGSIAFDTCRRREWDWDRFRMIGYGNLHPVFTDHFAIEDRYQHILNEMHRWDDDHADQ